VVSGRLDSLQVVPCGPERAEEVHRLTQAAFGSYRQLAPPSGALRESVTRVIDDLRGGGGAIADLEGRPVGCLRWQVATDGDFHVRRVAVAPELQHRGVGRALMAWAEREARRRGCEGVSVGVRIALPGNLAFYRELGYAVTGEHRHDGYDRTTWLALRKHVPGPQEAADG
jgi:GNAT superfamily N-acetyltransferase